MRLIDVDDLGVGRCSKDVLPAAYCAGWNGLLGLIEKASTVDAVPVVRCKDCKNWIPGGYKSIVDPQNPKCGGRCWYSNVARFENDFCSYGERKEGAGGEST